MALSLSLLASCRYEAVLYFSKEVLLWIDQNDEYESFIDGKEAIYMEKLDKRVNNNEELLLTRDGLAKLEKELNNLRTVKRKEIAARIKEAISYGDITDNSEYEDAKNEQAFIEGRIITLEKMLRRARLLEKEENGDQRIVLGSTVQLKDLDVNELYEYTIVSTAEADPVEKKISNESPVGKALLGLTVGDQVEIKVPVGTLKYKIEAVN